MKDDVRKLKPVNFDYLCRKCWKFQEGSEDFYGFDVEDDMSHVIEIRGHKECVDEIRDAIMKVVNTEK